MRILLMLMLVAGCASPALRFNGAERQEVRVGGHDFTVFALSDEAQVIRTNRVVLPDPAQVKASAVLAAEAATGCRVHRGRISGDAAILTVGLIC